MISTLEYAAPKGVWNKTPLQEATIKGRLRVVKLLLPKMALVDILHKDEFSQKTALQFGMENGYHEIVEYIQHYIKKRYK